MTETKEYCRTTPDNRIFDRLKKYSEITYGTQAYALSGKEAAFICKEREELIKAHDFQVGLNRELQKLCKESLPEYERLAKERDLAFQVNEMNFEKYAAGAQTLKNKLTAGVVAANGAINLIRKWMNINSVMGPDLQEAGNLLSYFLACNPEFQNEYLKGKK